MNGPQESILTCPGCGFDAPACCCLLDDNDQQDEFDDELDRCHGYFEGADSRGVFVCGAAGSEDCDQCPLSGWCGFTSKQIDGLEEKPRCAG